MFIYELKSKNTTIIGADGRTTYDFFMSLVYQILTKTSRENLMVFNDIWFEQVVHVKIFSPNLE